jgi:hypothetical protein
MINQPTTGRLLEGVVETLESVVLPELARGGAARRQLHAAIDILRRLAFAAPRIGHSLDADNADIAATLRRLGPLADQAAVDDAEALPDREARNAGLQALLLLAQAKVEKEGPDAATELRALYRRMLEREIALIPPSRPAKGSP